MKPFRELIVWQKAHEMTLDAYRLTKSFPTEEMYGLTSQIRRSASSVAANIAEGCGRKGDAEYCRFFQIAMGSASELEYHILLSKDLGLIDKREYDSVNEKIVEVKKMLSSFIKKLQSDR